MGSTAPTAKTKFDQAAGDENVLCYFQRHDNKAANSWIALGKNENTEFENPEMYARKIWK